MPNRSPESSREHSVPRRLMLAYTTASCLLVAMIVASSLTTIAFTRRQLPEGQRINLMGRQRMLTERTIASGYAAALARRGPPSDLTGATTALRQANEVRLLNANALRDGDPTRGLAAADAAERQALTPIIALDHAIASVITAMTQATAVDTMPRLAERLAFLGRQQITTIDSVTTDAARAQYAGARKLEVLQGISAAGLLALLLAIGITIMRPAATRIAELLEAQRRVSAHLYEQTQQMHEASVEREHAHDELESQRLALTEQKEELLAQQSTLIEQRDHLEQQTSELSRLSAILDATPDAVLAFSLTGAVLYANATAEKLLAGVRRRDWKHAAHAMTRDGISLLRNTAFPSALRRGVWRGEAVLRATAESAERTMVLTLQTHRSLEGRVTTVSVMLHDISATRLAERQLVVSEARTRAVIDALAEGVVVQDKGGRIISCNASAERVLGLTADQLFGRSSMDPAWYAVDAAGEPMPGDMHPVMRAQRDGVEIDEEIMGVQRPDGTRVWLSVNARPIRESIDEHDAAAVATFSDITRARESARELEALSVVARQSAYAIAMHDTEGRVTWINDAWETLTGFPLADVIGRVPGAFLRGTHTDPATAAAITSALGSGSKWAGEILHYRRNGTPYWAELSFSPTFSSDGTQTGFAGLARDISERRKLERERTQLAAALAVTADGIATTSVAGTLEFVNAAFARMHGRAPEELLHTAWTALYEPTEAARLARDIVPEVMHSGFWHGETTGRHFDGTTYPQELSLTLMPHGGLVTVARDISERKNAEEQLRRFSLRDSLTGLYNRRGFLEQTDSALKLAARQGVHCMLLYGDLDAFKTVNDGYGHDAGDRALQTIAEILTATFRDTDLVARLGGDEFTVLAIDVQPQDVAQILSRIDAAVGASNFQRNEDPSGRWHLGISLGAAHFDPEAPLDVHALLRVADAAQYDEKRRRKSSGRQAA